jgi:hypothetical protein
MEHEWGEAEKCKPAKVGCKPLVVACQSAEARDIGKVALHHPAWGHDHAIANGNN